MHIAIFSDIHGNPYACEAVLEAIRVEGPFDAVAAAGDHCFGGSDPACCIDRLREAGVQAVYGNTDEFIFNPEIAPPDEAHQREWHRYQAAAKWAAEKLGEERVAWLKALPFELLFSPTDNPKNDLLVVHANPKNVHDHIAPPYEDQVELVGEVTQPDDDPKLVSLLEDELAGVIAFGHLHYTSLRVWRGKKLVNVAPCSIASYDGDQRARYTVFTWGSKSWEIERHYVPYEVQKEGKALLASDIPDKEKKAAYFE